VRRAIPLCAALALVLANAAPAAAEPARVWQVNGIRLEPDQVERLAGDIARQTVAAVERLDGLELVADQPARLERIYRDVALDVYGAAVRVVQREDLGDAEKEERVKTLVLDGQARSTDRVAEVLDASQYAVYRAWETRQVEAFRHRGLWGRGSRGRR
jgi:hypothetical protein